MYATGHKSRGLGKNYSIILFCLIFCCDLLLLMYLDVKKLHLNDVLLNFYQNIMSTKIPHINPILSISNYAG